MRVTQFYNNDGLHLGRIEGDQLKTLDFRGDMIDFIQSGSQSSLTGESRPLAEIRFAPVVTRPSKIICIGLNYLDHVQESKGRIPEVPLLFAKFPNTLIGHREEIIWDSSLTSKVDFEAELAVIIGRKIQRAAENEVMDAVFGYTCANDVSARDLQFGDKQWVRGKSLDTFCPLGPWIATSDEIPNPHELTIKFWLNGLKMQDSHTGMMIFKLPQLISFLSKNFTLFPGDVILTGTPHGVGAFRKPSVYMRDGDEAVVEIEGIGRLKNTCKVL